MKEWRVNLAFGENHPPYEFQGGSGEHPHKPYGKPRSLTGVLPKCEDSEGVFPERARLMACGVVKIYR